MYFVVIVILIDSYSYYRTIKPLSIVYRVSLNDVDTRCTIAGTSESRYCCY